MSAHAPCLHTYPLLSFLLHTLSSFPPYYTAHEAVLQDVCWVPSRVESLLVTPDGGVFPLEPKGSNNEGDEDMIQLHVPQGAVRADGEGVLEVRYAVIPDGPFRTPEGYKLCSMAVYLYYDPAQTTKPFYLLLPHWSGAPDHPTFVTSPHTLSEGERYYHFHLVEGGEFSKRCGTLEVHGHCTLFAEANRLEDTGIYRASQWEREESNILYSKLAITFDSNIWIRVSVSLVLLPKFFWHYSFSFQILKTHWKEWKKRFTESFEFMEDHIESSLSEDSGRGWSASVVKNWVCESSCFV